MVISRRRACHRRFGMAEGEIIYFNGMLTMDLHR